MQMDQGRQGSLGLIMIAWGALGLALMLGGADPHHYATAVVAFGVALGVAWIARRSGRDRLAVALLIAPPVIAAGGIVLFMIRLAAGFFL